MLRRFMAVAALAALGFTACASEEPALEGTPPAGGTEPAVSISSPADGSTMDAGDVAVTVAVENLEIVDKLSQPAVDGEGHVHFYIDVEEADLPTTPDVAAVTPDDSTYHAAATTSYTWEDVEAGEHTLCAQLVENNHFPLEPAVTDCVTVTVS